MKASKCRESWLQTVLRLSDWTVLSPQEDLHSTPYKTQGTTQMKGGENIRVSDRGKRHEMLSCGLYTTNNHHIITAVTASHGHTKGYTCQQSVIGL